MFYNHCYLNIIYYNILLSYYCFYETHRYIRRYYIIIQLENILVNKILFSQLKHTKNQQNNCTIFKHNMTVNTISVWPFSRNDEK